MAGPEDFFREQFDRIEAFLLDPDKNVLRLTIDPEMHRVPARFLEAKDADDDFRHLILHNAEPFLTHVHWNNALLKSLDAQITAHADALKEKGVDVARATEERHPTHQPWKSFLDRAEVLARGLTDYVDSIVFLLTPESVGDADNWRRTVRFFADTVAVSEVKFIIYDARTAPLLEDIADHPKVVTQCFWLSPDEIEKRAAAQLSAGAAKGGEPLAPAQKRQALATVGLMAFSRKDYKTAEKAQREHLKEAQASKDPSDIALALYNLGNTYLEAAQNDRAVEVLTRAADGCLFHELDQIAPMAFCNLGVALYRSGEPDQGVSCLKAAREMFRAQRNLPGEAHVCDSLALLHHGVGRRDEAQKAWKFALGLYEKIENPDLQDVRRGARRDILHKMKHLGYAHG
jgi:tetratricopeptide (TPR) repeat protein